MKIWKSPTPSKAGVIPLCQAKWHSWQRKEQAESRQRVKWPQDVNNLGGWGRPALINAGQQCCLSGIVGGAQSLAPPHPTPVGVLITPPSTTIIKALGRDCSPPLTPALTPCIIMRGCLWEWPKLCQLNASLPTPHHHYCRLILPPLHQWFSVLLFQIQTKTRWLDVFFCTRPNHTSFLHPQQEIDSFD